jgi:glutathione S-transferase
MRVYRIPLSTNVERVALGLGYKGLEVAWIDVPADDRSEVVRVSGQELVPVLDDDGLILPDSVAILRYVEERHPEPTLWPREPARRAEADIFVDWFDRLWKRAPNLIAAGRDAAKYGPRITGALDLFESMLDGRGYLLGDFGIVDVAAFPFVKYATDENPDDHSNFHQILRDWQPIEGRPLVEAWIARVDAKPRA